MTTKNDIIQRAYQEIRVSGLTVNPNPTDEALALVRLETMMSEFFTNWNMDVGYNFQTTAVLTDQTNVPLNYESMMAYNLAVRLIPAFNKQVPQTLYGLASTSFSSSLGVVKSQQIRQIQPSRRMPRGSGNTFRDVYWDRFSQPVPLPPTSSANNPIYEGETQDYYEDFSAWLGSNTIASFTIAADPRLTIDTSANTDTRVTYTITAGDSGSEGEWQYVKITVTDSAGRVDIRLINFLVADPPTVP